MSHIQRTQRSIEMIKGLASKDLAVRKKSLEDYGEHVLKPIHEMLNGITEEENNKMFREVSGDIAKLMAKHNITLEFSPSAEIHPQCS